MKQVKFLDLWGQGSVDVPDIGKRFHAGQVESLTDEEAALLKGNGNFEEVGSAQYKTNPSPSPSHLEPTL